MLAQENLQFRERSRELCSLLDQDKRRISVELLLAWAVCVHGMGLGGILGKECRERMLLSLPAEQLFHLGGLSPRTK